MAGATIAAGVDAWDRAITAYATNFPEADARLEELHDKSRPPRAMRDAGVDLLLASPECTNHSCAKGARPRDEESKRSARYLLGYAKTLEPRWIVIENVVQMREWSGFRALCTELEGMGYHLRQQTLDASEFGVPQSRRRLFVMADRRAQPAEIARPRLRTPRVAESIIDFSGRWPSKPLYSEGRATATIERAERAIAELGRAEPFLVVYYGSDGAGGWQSLDRPLRTMTTLDRFGLVTWAGRTPMLRMLQVDELKRAMGFPAAFKLAAGTRREKIMMLGNAVCPPVMSAIVSSLCRDKLPTRAT
jgi:DNA (cytosine-5)-methyltransferase 1